MAKQNSGEACGQPACGGKAEAVCECRCRGPIHSAVRGLGWALAAYGIVLMAAWHLHVAALVHWGSTHVPITYNAALGFALVGVGVLAANGCRYGRSLTIAAGLLVLAGVGAAQYLFHTDLGIDQWAVDQSTLPANPYPGRVAPNSLTCFALVAMALLALAGRQRAQLRSLLASLFGSLVVAFGLVVVFGYLSGVESAAAWAQMKPMSPPAAVGFVMLGLAILGLAWRKETAGQAAAPSWLPLPITLALAAVTLLLSTAMRQPGPHQVTLPSLALVMGLAMALLSGVAIWLAQAARSRSRQLEAANLESQRRNRQQAAAAELGQLALDPATGLDELMDKAVARLAETLEVEYTKVLELLPGSGQLLLRSGVGWIEGLVGKATVSAGLESQAGYTLICQGPVIVEDLRQEARFTGPRLLHQHGVVSGMSVVIAGDAHGPYGVLGVHSRQQRRFTGQEVNFLTTTATILGQAIIRKRAEEAVRKASRYARSLIEASLDPLVTISKDGKITDVNQASEQVTGVPRTRLIGSDFSDYFTQPEKARHGYEEVFAKGIVRDYPLAIRSQSGQVTHVLYNASLYRDERDEVQGIFAAARDISERKQAEEELEKASRYARSLIEASLDPLVTISKDGKITDVNQATEQVTGVSRGKLIGSDFSDYFTEPEKAGQGYQRAFAEGQVRDYPLAIRSRSGQVTEVLYNATVFKNEAGEIEGVFAAARDITERKRAELALAAERQRFSDVLDKLPAYVVLLAMDYRVPFANRFFRERFGESKGRRCYEYLFGRSEPCEICESFKVAKTGEPWHWEWTGPDRRQYDIYDFPFTDTDGSSLILEMGLDVTERKQAEEQIRCLNAELEDRVASRTAELATTVKDLEAFTYSVSHDLRAPLRQINGFAKLLVEDFGPSLDAKAQEYLRWVQDGTRRMGQLVDDLLNLSRVGRRELRPQTAGMASLVKEAIADLAGEVEGREIDWQIGDLPFLECDAALMKQVWANLLSNAVKFTRMRKPARIQVGQEEREGQKVLFVRDNGVGFSMKYADKLFGVFQRLHREEDFEGTGVGLATVHRIIQKHGGRIWAEAELDKGASFYFTLGETALAHPPDDRPAKAAAPEEVQVA